MAVEPPTGPLKVLLWTTGRSLSNAFLQCMTYVPDTIAWHEPYSQLGKFSNVVEGPAVSKTVQELVKTLGGASAVAKIESGYDASDKDYDWLKEQLESDLPDGKRMLFAKAHGAYIRRFSLFDKLPQGFRHTFLIRNPKATMMSKLKMSLKLQARSVKLPELPRDQFRIYEYLIELLKYLKAEGLESRPIIIDADDLLENPKEMLEAYCHEVGIPFTEDLLTWPAGDDVMTKMWMTPKQTILTFGVMGFAETTFACTGFKKKPVSTFDANKDDEFLKQFPPAALEKVKAILEKEMPFYEEMYRQRLTVTK
ncbi:uncharacterized protein [Amphiura filiformis]|uniref:uncharacterized protein n=1 Tax=Amphiura filiformis TaxID=82378 RepID=UPI003B21B087